MVAAQAPARPIELRWTVGDEQLAACELRDVAFCPPNGPLCVERDSRLQLLVSDTVEPVRLQLQVWRRAAKSR